MVALQGLMTAIEDNIDLEGFHGNKDSDYIINALRSMVADQVQLSRALLTKLNQKRSDFVELHLKEEFEKLCRPT